jgi:hypothetical protein
MPNRVQHGNTNLTWTQGITCMASRATCPCTLAQNPRHSAQAPRTFNARTFSASQMPDTYFVARVRFLSRSLSLLKALRLGE